MTIAYFVTKPTASVIPIKLVTQVHYTDWLNTQDELTRTWLLSTQFKGENGNVSLVPDSCGQLSFVVCCVTDIDSLWAIAGLPPLLPKGCYELNVSLTKHPRLALGWGLGSYQFTRYKKAMREPASLYCPDESTLKYISSQVESIYWVRDLINTPAEDLGPSELAHVVDQFAERFNAEVRHVVGKDLLLQNYPLIYAVGKGCDDAPRLIDLVWGNENHPRITLIGKGVCFDTGGLDIKPSLSMLLMKKDMGGAAHVLGLAQMIIEAELPIRLRVLIPAVENSISDKSYRPGDILPSRKGLSVEIGNTDAEGRLVLADALTEAVSDAPELIIDIATLTGAARIALGTDLPALFSNQDDILNDIVQHSKAVSDPLWPMPLYAPYREFLNTPFADINNTSVDSYGGAITAALFLKEFVPDSIPWVHLDLMAWNLRPRPGRPQGGEAMALRALFGYLQSKYE